MAFNGLMQGKKGLIMGVANDHSLAWGIAQQLAIQGADLAFTYVGESLQKRVEPLAQSVNSELVLPCNVTSEDEVAKLFAEIQNKWGKIDFLLHAIAFSDKKELRGEYIDTSRENFFNTLDISCYSLTTIAKHAKPLMQQNGGSILTLTYFGAEKVLPNYNVMGVAKAALETSVRYLAVDLGQHNIRINSLSSGPVRTLSAAGIGDFREMLKWTQENSPLQRNVELQEVGKSGLYLLSDLASGVTGENHHVDCGYNIMGMKNGNSCDE